MNHTTAPMNETSIAANDEELLLRYRDHGDQTAFDALVHRTSANSTAT